MYSIERKQFPSIDMVDICTQNVATGSAVLNGWRFDIQFPSMISLDMFFSSWLCLWPTKCWKFFSTRNSKFPVQPPKVLLLAIGVLPLVSSMRMDTESSACTTLPFGVKIGKCCTPRCNGRDGDLDGLALVAMVEPGFRFWEGRTSSRPNFRRWCMKIRFM